MKILVTGGYGNLGSRVVPDLLARGHDVRCLSNEYRRDERVSLKYFNAPVKTVRGDIRRSVDLAPALDGVDAVIHLAFILPPQADEDPIHAADVNVGGTQTLITQAQRQPKPPTIYFASSFDVFGHTQHLPPPRRVGDAVKGTDLYSRHKLVCEEMVRGSGLPHVIFRFADIPPRALRQPHPIMFRLPLDTRIEVIHGADAATAVCNAIDKRDETLGRVWLIGGGKSCQLHYRQYLSAYLDMLGIAPLPEELFDSEPYPTDWLDTDESQRVLAYQRHTFDDIIRDVAAQIGWRRFLIRLMKPVARAQVIAMGEGRKAALHAHDGHGHAHDAHDAHDAHH